MLHLRSAARNERADRRDTEAQGARIHGEGREAQANRRYELAPPRRCAGHSDCSAVAPVFFRSDDVKARCPRSCHRRTPNTPATATIDATGSTTSSPAAGSSIRPSFRFDIHTTEATHSISAKVFCHGFPGGTGLPLRRTRSPERPGATFGVSCCPGRLGCYNASHAHIGAAFGVSCCPGHPSCHNSSHAHIGTAIGIPGSACSSPAFVRGARSCTGHGRQIRPTFRVSRGRSGLRRPCSHPNVSCRAIAIVRTPAVAPKDIPAHSRGASVLATGCGFRAQEDDPDRVRATQLLV